MFGGGPAVQQLSLFPRLGTLYNSTGADGEVPAATFALLGLLAVLREVRIGAFFLWFALLWKATALCYVVTAAGSFWRAKTASVVARLRSPAVVAMGGFLLLYPRTTSCFWGVAAWDTSFTTPSAFLRLSPGAVRGRSLHLYLAATSLLLVAAALAECPRSVTMARCSPLPPASQAALHAVLRAPLGLLGCRPVRAASRKGGPTRRTAVAALMIGALAVNTAGLSWAKEQGLSRQTPVGPAGAQVCGDLPRGAQCCTEGVAAI